MVGWYSQLVVFSRFFCLSVSQSFIRTVIRSVSQSVNQFVKKIIVSVYLSISQSVIVSVNQSFNQSVTQSANQSISQPLTIDLHRASPPSYHSAICWSCPRSPPPPMFWAWMPHHLPSTVACSTPGRTCCVDVVF